MGLFIILSTIVEIKICFQIKYMERIPDTSTIVEIKICFQISCKSVIYPTSTIVEIKICFQIDEYLCNDCYLQ